MYTECSRDSEEHLRPEHQDITTIQAALLVWTPRDPQKIQGAGSPPGRHEPLTLLTPSDAAGRRAAEKLAIAYSDNT